MSCLSMPADARPDQTYTHIRARTQTQTHTHSQTYMLYFLTDNIFIGFFFLFHRQHGVTQRSSVGRNRTQTHTNRKVKKHKHRFKNDILINKPIFLCQHFYFIFFWTGMKSERMMMSPPHNPLSQLWYFFF